MLKYYIWRLDSFRGYSLEFESAQFLYLICVISSFLTAIRQIETMVDNADIKCINPSGSKSISCTGSPSLDISPGYQEPTVRKVYKRRFIGVAHLALLNIVVSWDVSYQLPATIRQNY